MELSSEIMDKKCDYTSLELGIILRLHGANEREHEFIKRAYEKAVEGEGYVIAVKLRALAKAIYGKRNKYSREELVAIWDAMFSLCKKRGAKMLAIEMIPPKDLEAKCIFLSEGKLTERAKVYFNDDDYLPYSYFEFWAQEFVRL